MIGAGISGTDATRSVRAASQSTALRSRRTPSAKDVGQTLGFASVPRMPRALRPTRPRRPDRGSRRQPRTDCTAPITGAATGRDAHVSDGTWSCRLLTTPGNAAPQRPPLRPDRRRDGSHVRDHRRRCGPPVLALVQAEASDGAADRPRRRRPTRVLKSRLARIDPTAPSAVGAGRRDAVIALRTGSPRSIRDRDPRSCPASIREVKSRSDRPPRGR